MTSPKTLLALSVVALLTACASPGSPGMKASAPAPATAKAEEHTQHHPADAAAVPAPVPVPGMEARMKSMREMHDKMMKAKTPEERQALMAEHMKAMQDGMQMMKQMDGMGSMGGMAGPGAGMKGMGPMPADAAKRQQMMEQRMDMMQTMMEMMMQRMPGAGMGTMSK